MGIVLEFQELNFKTFRLIKLFQKFQIKNYCKPGDLLGPAPIKSACALRSTRI